ncbi:Septin-4 [Halocaridina rubra]|uniref:Septin-4 n=1 Tax=Halocaridina rubra TaxID=373956 RepID=A0AAN9AG27_HALRR
MLHFQQVAMKERNKLKRESAANFDQVGDADKLLQQKDEEIRRMQEMLSQMQEKLKESGKDQAAAALSLEPGKRDSVVNV